MEEGGLLSLDFSAGLEAPSTVGSPTPAARRFRATRER